MIMSPMLRKMGGTLAAEISVEVAELTTLVAIADLCRIQWVSSKFTRALLATGHAIAASVAKADPESLCNAIVEAKDGGQFYKGEVGLSDVWRLVTAAAFVPRH